MIEKECEVSLVEPAHFERIDRELNESGDRMIEVIATTTVKTATTTVTLMMHASAWGGYGDEADGEIFSAYEDGDAPPYVEVTYVQRDGLRT